MCRLNDSIFKQTNVLVDYPSNKEGGVLRRCIRAVGGVGRPADRQGGLGRMFWHPIEPILELSLKVANFFDSATA